MKNPSQDLRRCLFVASRLRRSAGYLRAWICSWIRRAKKEIAFLLFSLSLDRDAISQEITAVILTVDPNHLYNLCLESVKNQTLRPSVIETVCNITPVSMAEQTGLDLVKTEYYVSVDADMLLDRTYFERLYFIMKRTPRCAQVSLHVIDPILGKIMAGGRMYRTKAVRQIGFHPFEGARDHDRYMTGKLKACGYEICRDGWVAGQHHPVYLPHEAFWKFRVNAEKARYYGDRYPTFRNLIDHVVNYWRMSHDDVALYALAGLFDGLKSDDVGKELTYEGRASDPAFLKIRAFIEETGNKLTSASQNVAAFKEDTDQSGQSD